jgi:hypothetical protein
MKSRHVVIALVALLLGLQGGAALAYTDEQILGLELSGQLLAPPEMVTQIAADLAAIRQYDGYFSSIHVFPSWPPGELIVALTSEAWQLYLAGQYHGLDALNAQYGPPQVEVFSTYFHELHLTFSQAYNPVLLAAIYETAEGVAYASNRVFYGDGDDIVATALGSYTFRHGWGDCPAGCSFRHYWEFTVTNGVVQLVSEHGDPFGACCLADHTCVLAIRWECIDQGYEGLWGTYHGGACVPSPCGTTAATEPGERVGWGRIKSLYR